MALRQTGNVILRAGDGKSNVRRAAWALDTRARTATEKAAAILDDIRSDDIWGVNNPRLTDIMLLDADGLVNEAVELMKKSAREADGEKK